MRTRRPPCARLILALAALACKGGDDATATTAAAGEAVPPSIIGPQTTPYRGRADLPGGAVRVRVALDGDAPADSAWSPPADLQAVCGPAVPDERVVRDGDRLANVVVWLPDVREGKPLPVERRHELVVERCRLTPRVQAMVAGGTLNLRAEDATAHRTRFVRHGDGARLAEIATTEPMSVVPDESVLRRPGQVEVTCALHPWARAWLLAFDHPYAAVTARDGGVRLDSVPAGRWRVLVWHERFGLREDTVDVAIGQESELEVRLQAR